MKLFLSHSEGPADKVSNEPYSRRRQKDVYILICAVLQTIFIPSTPLVIQIMSV